MSVRVNCLGVQQLDEFEGAEIYYVRIERTHSGDIVETASLEGNAVASLTSEGIGSEKNHRSSNWNRVID